MNHEARVIAAAMVFVAHLSMRFSQREKGGKGGSAGDHFLTPRPEAAVSLLPVTTGHGSIPLARPPLSRCRMAHGALPPWPCCP
ncbi:hypothetical protein NDU88_005514 [Pleurodeles waltl]|uniref:Uncharacterized protein n=1 Tax=Pleurodeles waltl TaxID=8319 RepID=A0AAV7WBQ5_PLEWA|nr:hypothetical protein NDU88_005514 [Pleurodeles waltl]